MSFIHKRTYMLLLLLSSLVFRPCALHGFPKGLMSTWLALMTLRMRHKALHRHNQLAITDMMLWSWLFEILVALPFLSRLTFPYFFLSGKAFNLVDYFISFWRMLKRKKGRNHCYLRILSDSPIKTTFLWQRDKWIFIALFTLIACNVGCW